MKERVPQSRQRLPPPPRPDGYVPVGDVARDSLATSQPEPDPPGFEVQTGAQVFASTYKAPEAINDELQLYRGARAFGLVAVKDTFKTLVGMQLAVDTAAGLPAFDRFTTTAGPVPVLYVPYDHPPSVGHHRLKRMAYTPELREAVEANYHTVTVPGIFLNTDGAVDIIGNTMVKHGIKLAIFDALRTATPGEDEDDSRFRMFVDNLMHIAVKANAAVGVTAHAGHANGKKTRPRGSSGISDGLGCVYVLDRRNDNAVTVSHERPALETYGNKLEPFTLRVEDVEIAGDPHAGLRVVADGGGVSAEDRERVVRVVAANPGASQTVIAEKLGGKLQVARALPHRVAALGDIRKEPNGVGWKFFPLEAAQ